MKNKENLLYPYFPDYQTKEVYQLIKFDRSVNDFFVLDKSEDFVYVVQQAIHCINSDISHCNVCSTNRLLEYDEAYETFKEGKNWVVNNVVYGIICCVVPCEVSLPKYEDKIVLIKDCDMNESDIKAIQMPFESESFFRGYMKRTCEVFGGTYRLIDPYMLDLSYDILKEKYSHIVHTKIAK